MKIFEFLWDVNVLEVTPDLVLSVACKRAHITLILFDVEVLLPYMKSQLIVSFHNFPTMRATTLISFVLHESVNVFHMPRYIKTRVGRVITVITMEVFDFHMHPFDVQWNFPFFCEGFSADWALFAKKINSYWTWQKWNLSELTRRDSRED